MEERLMGAELYSEDSDEISLRPKLLRNILVKQSQKEI